MVNGGKIIGQNSTVIFEPYHFRAAICTIVCFCQQEISCSLPTKDSIFVDKSSGGSRAYLCEFLHFIFWYPRWDSNPHAIKRQILSLLCITNFTTRAQSIKHNLHNLQTLRKNFRILHVSS